MFRYSLVCSGTLCVVLRLPGVSWNSLACSGLPDVFWVSLVFSGTHWCVLGLTGVFWDSLACPGTLWCVLGLTGMSLDSLVDSLVCPGTYWCVVLLTWTESRRDCSAACLGLRLLTVLCSLDGSRQQAFSARNRIPKCTLFCEGPGSTPPELRAKLR